MKILILLIGVSIMILTSCSKKENYDIDKTKSEVLKTVYAHNKAWTKLLLFVILEDLVLS